MKNSITVLMPVYNVENYLREAIDSILNQTFPYFEFIIINDGSNDRSEKIILSYNDNRIQYFKNETNLGLVATLNKGIKLIETKYIVRMDADDISMPERLQMQYDFMEKNDDIGVCGSFFEIFGQESRIPNLALEDNQIKARLLFANPICHPSVILRTEIFKSYSANYGVSFLYNDGQKILELEDYALWHKLKPHIKFANISAVLLKYRKEGQNLTSYKTDLIFERKKKFYSHILKELMIEPSELNLALHISLKNIYLSKSEKDVIKFRYYLKSLIQANQKNEIYPPLALKEEIELKWSRFFYYLVPLGWKYVKNYWRSSPKIQHSHLVYYLKFIIRNIILSHKVF